VYPSAGACDTVAAAMAPLAPDLDSTMQGWPQASVSFWPMIRIMVSWSPPAGVGITNLMTCEGKGCVCACARGRTPAPSEPRAAASVWRRVNFIAMSPCVMDLAAIRFVEIIGSTID